MSVLMGARSAWKSCAKAATLDLIAAADGAGLDEVIAPHPNGAADDNSHASPKASGTRIPRGHGHGRAVGGGDSDDMGRADPDVRARAFMTSPYYGIEMRSR
jgi:hypothetical protein